MKTVFLGGTCNNSKWRDELIPLLKIDYFNPVVDNWTPECQQRELKAREDSDFVLYVITAEMIGYYSIAEAVDDSNKRPKKTIFCVLDDPMDASQQNHFNKFQMKSFQAIKQLVSKNGATVLDNLEDIAMFINNQR